MARPQFAGEEEDRVSANTSMLNR